MIICAGGNENFSFAKNIGIGLIQSAINLSEICLKYKPSKLIFIGTCGLYFKDINDKQDNKLLQIYSSNHAFNVEYSFLSDGFYSPIKNEAKSDINIFNVSYETLRKTNSSNYICTNEKATIKFANLGFELENMEAFSVLSVANKFKIPAICYLCATNFCDKDAHQNFIKNHQKAKQRLSDFLELKNLI